VYPTFLANISRNNPAAAGNPRRPAAACAATPRCTAAAGWP